MKHAHILLVSILSLASAQTAWSAEVVTFRSGQVGGTPGLPGQADSNVRSLSGSTCCAPLSATAFTPAQFAAASSGVSARIVTPSSAWAAPSLPPDPSARWIHNSSTNGYPSPAVSSLYAIDFSITTPGATSARLDIAYSADDTLGDYYDSTPANPSRFYVNGIPIPVTTVPGGFGGWRSETYLAVPVHTGTNTLYVYQRDGGGSVSGLIFTARVSIGVEFTLESEPNGTKAESDLVTPVFEGDCITGTSTGGVIGSGNGGLASADYFRIRTLAQPLGVYRHELTLTSATPGHTATLRGLSQVSGGVGQPGIVVAGTDVALQTSTSSPTRMNAWYGFGRGEGVFYAVSGTSATTSSYSACLVTTAVPVEDLTLPNLPPLLQAGSIVITTVGQGHSSDTELHLFDANLVPIPGGSNDEIAGGGGSLSQLVRTLTPGEYYLAVGVHNVATDHNSPADDAATTSSVLDLPDAIASSSSTSALDVSFSISDGTSTIAKTASLPASTAFALRFYRFQLYTVGVSQVCDTAGQPTLCPCGNSGAPGNGCANSSAPLGANLSTAGVAGASASTDSLVLTATDVPGPCLFFQGTSWWTGGVFLGDGVLCAGGSIIRLGVVFPFVGMASYPGGSAPNPIHVAGATSPGDVRTYQAWYRDAAPFCTAGTFNLTQGLSVLWGP